jgi:hypothetical protein
MPPAAVFTILASARLVVANVEVCVYGSIQLLTKTQ